MKTKTGLVSDRSSSSSLICYRDEKDFDVFSKFKGYAWLKEHLTKFDKHVLFCFVEQSIHSYLHMQWGNIRNSRKESPPSGG